MSKWCQDVASRCVPTPQLNLASVNFKVHHASICYISKKNIYIYMLIFFEYKYCDFTAQELKSQLNGLVQHVV